LLLCVDNCLVWRVEFYGHIEDSGIVLLRNFGECIPINTESSHETKVF